MWRHVSDTESHVQPPSTSCVNEESHLKAPTMHCCRRGLPPTILEKDKGTDGTRVSVTHREQLDRIGQNVVKNIVTKATRKGFSSTDSFSVQSGGGGGAAALDRMGGSSSPLNGPQDPVQYRFSTTFSLRLSGPTHQDPEGEPVQSVQKYCNRSEVGPRLSISLPAGPSDHQNPAGPSSLFHQTHEDSIVLFSFTGVMGGGAAGPHRALGF